MRYADDFVVLCTTPEEAKLAKAFVEEVLEQLKLSLHEARTPLTDFREGFDFVGFRFRWFRLGIRVKSLSWFQDKVRLLTRRQQGRNVDAILQDLNPVLRGFARYFGIAEVSGLDCSIASTPGPVCAPRIQDQAPSSHGQPAPTQPTAGEVGPALPATVQAVQTTLLHEGGSLASRLKVPCHEAPARGRSVR